MGSVTVGGREVHYSDPGGPGIPVVLGHGFFLNRTVFEPQRAALEPRFRVISWDARGHGAAAAAESGSYTYWDQAADLLGLLDALGLDTAVVGGVSQGGFIALRAGLLAPERITGLVLMDTEATECDPDDRAGYEQMFAELAQRGPVTELLEPLARQLLGDHPALITRWQELWRTRPLPLGPAAECLMRRDDVSGRLGEITCPVMLLWGSLDRSLPRDRMDLLRDRLPAATEVAVIDGAAHTPTLTHPEAVNAALLEFLARLPLAQHPVP